MIEKMTAYFVAEKQESLMFMAVGVLAVAVWRPSGMRARSMLLALTLCVGCSAASTKS